MRVASENSGHPSATVGIWIDSGSRNETDANNGVAHFLEHMSFKGTTTRTQRDIELEIENMGALLNAYTSREMTVYYAFVDKKDIKSALTIIADILQRSTFPADLLERERYVICREMEEVTSDNEEFLFDILHGVAYENSPLSRTILGPEENIMSLKKDDIISYIQKNYSCDRIVICGAGGVCHEELVRIAQEQFSNFPVFAENKDFLKSTFKGGEKRISDTSMPLGHVVLSFEGSSWSHPNFFPFQLASQLIGSWNRFAGGNVNESNPLANRVAESDLAHKFMSFTTCYAETGLWGACFSSEPNKVREMAYAVIDEWNRLVYNADESDLARAKQILKMMCMNSVDSTQQVCDEIGRQILTIGRRMSPAEAIARIDAVNLVEVRTLLQKTLRSPLAIAAVGQIEDLPDYNKLISAIKVS
ncbi:mitochondrial-processing peptidase subunit beta-like [Zophobas morio]|uniref:mitochondrial-processing peptidase subunit beta-like n=1 Tax=Zophobas morio TaxID=2755281 RepID=UPI00308284EC